MAHVLLVDDDQIIRRLMRVNLESRSFTVSEARDGKEAIEQMRRAPQPDLIVLDLAMPKMDGIEVCQWVRKSHDTPIIVLSAFNEEPLKVQALNEGADDYVTKPFSAEEFMARIRAVMRRANDVKSETASDIIVVGGFRLNLSAQRAFVDDEDMQLTRTEFALLAELVRNRDHVMSHDTLLMRVWGPEYRGSNHYLHVYMGRVRQKLKHYHALVETSSGVGYIFHSTLPNS